MLAEMRGPGNWPLATTVLNALAISKVKMRIYYHNGYTYERVVPSGARFLLAIVKSIDTVAACARCDRDSERSEDINVDVNILSRSGRE